jgi:hypothetical protein
MVDDTYVPAIKKAIQTNELGSASPYQLCFARKGASGASFGVFQGDTNVNPTARSTLMKVLAAAQADQATCSRILAALSQPCPNGDPLSGADAALVNNALSSPPGRALVDGMDSELLTTVLGELDGCLSAAARADHTIQPEALLYMALWVNMTGAPTTLMAWLSGATEVGLPPPIGPAVTALDIENYLHANTYFRRYPQNFLHMQESVNSALGLLP